MRAILSACLLIASLSFATWGRAEQPYLTRDCATKVDTLAKQYKEKGSKYYFQGLGDGDQCKVTGGHVGDPGWSDDPVGAFYIYGFFDKAGGDATRPVVLLTDSSVTKVPFDRKGVHYSEVALFGWSGKNNTESRIQAAHVDGKFTDGTPLGGTLNVWGWFPGDISGFHLIGTWTVAEKPVTLKEQLATDGLRIGASAAYVRTERAAPSGQQVDRVNPPPVLFQGGRPMPNLARSFLGEAPRVRSWASAMTYADNDPALRWYQGADTWSALQGPVWADPLIVFYSSQTKAGDDRPHFSKGGLTQNAGADWNGASLFGAGFHVAMPAPMTITGAKYGAETADGQYNWGARVKRKTAAEDDPAGDVPGAIDSAGTWREMLVVFPSTAAKPTAPAYLPVNPSTEAEGDFDIVFRMSDPDHPESSLQMAVAQGSPFAQFSSVKNAKVTVALAYCPGYGIEADCLAPLTGGARPVVGTPFDVAVGSGTVRCQIVAQQVNQMYSDTMDNENARGSNWASFALMWDASGAGAPAQLSQDVGAKDRMIYLSLAADPLGTTHLVVAGLPSQMRNNLAAAEMPPFDLDAARPWAEDLARTAFNFYQGHSRVDFWVGKAADGTVRDPREVNVRYAPALVARGPALQDEGGHPLGTFLLQPHQYATGFRDGRPAGTRPVNLLGRSFLSHGSAQHPAAQNVYWISRGKLEALVADELSLTYLMPPMLPAFDASGFAAATVQGSTLGHAHLKGQTLKANDLAYALAMHLSWELAQGLDKGPAGTGLGGTPYAYGFIQDAYAAGQGMYYSAKLLHLLLRLQEPAELPAWFRQRPDPQPTLASMRSTLAQGLAEAFALYFGPRGGPVVTNGVREVDRPAGSADWRSFTYAYHHPGSRHLILYPAGTGPGFQPTQLGTGIAVADGFGTATKLSDASYTWGYLITAAALYATALKDPSVAWGAGIDPDWWKQDRWGPAVDLMIRDLANCDRASGETIPWWVDGTVLPSPRLDYMDLWTGISWANAFHPAGFDQKQHNAAQESQMSWAGTYLWGMVTGRKPVADLGAFLYTLGAYANEAYFLNTLGNHVPADQDTDPYAADYASDGTFLPRAQKNFSGGGQCWGKLPAQTLIHGGRGASAWQTQPYLGADASVASRPFQTPGVFCNRQWSQGEDGMPVLHGLFNILLPVEPMTLAFARDAAYLRALARADLLNRQGDTDTKHAPYQNLSYTGVVNKALAAVGADFSLSVQRRDPKTTPSSVTDRDVDPSCTTAGLVPPYDTPYLAFLTPDLSASKATAPFAWYLGMVTGGGGAANTLNPWIGVRTPGWDYTVADDTYFTAAARLGAKAWTDDANKVFTRGIDTAPALLDFWVYDRLGAPVFDLSATSTGGSLPALVMVFRSATGVPTAMAYNPNDVPVTVAFKALDPASTASLPEGATVPARRTMTWSRPTLTVSASPRSLRP